MTCEFRQHDGRTALLLASEGGHAATMRVLVELGASLEAVDKVNIHAHAFAYTCCIKHVFDIIMSHAYACYIYIYTFICRYVYSCVCMHVYIYIYINVCIYISNHHVCMYR
jgi:hypothetical protein